MGIEYRGLLVVGYDYETLHTIYENTVYEHEIDLYDFCESRDLNSFSPYYDADGDDCIYGRAVAKSADYSYEEVKMEFVQAKIDLAKKELLNEFGVEAAVYIMASGR